MSHDICEESNKQEAISFAKWIRQQGYNCIDDSWYLITFKENKYEFEEFTEEELYKLFDLMT